MGVDGLCHFEDWFIKKDKNGFSFGIDPFPREGVNSLLFFESSDFDSYDQCFRAARKWIRDNQNLVYKEVM